MIITRKFREFENLHIVMWLLKDSCWVLDWHLAGMIMIVPTLSLAFYITYLMRESKTELFHNLAVCSWIIANSVWMTGEFFYRDTLRPYATVFFALGVLMIFFYYFIHKPRVARKLKMQKASL